MTTTWMTSYLSRKHEGATPRVLAPPPPPRGLWPTVSCERYEPKEPMGARGSMSGLVAGDDTECEWSVHSGDGV